MEENKEEAIETEDDDDEVSSDSELDPSRLGTKEYWEEVFARDLAVYNETKDVGEIWFGNDSMKRVITWMLKSELVSRNSHILDIGCGNGMMLIKLAKSGYRNLLGVDYVEDAVQLATAAAKEESADVTFTVGDILEDNCSFGHQFDVCHDKGTYDAISLSPLDSKLQRCKYVENIERLCLPGGLYLITSCNWTKDELVEHFSQGFTLLEQIPSPEFKFGGVTGRRETVLVFQRTSTILSVTSTVE